MFCLLRRIFGIPEETAWELSEGEADFPVGRVLAEPRPGGQQDARRPPGRNSAGEQADAGGRTGDSLPIPPASLHGGRVWRESAVSLLCELFRSCTHRGGKKGKERGV